MLAQRRFELVSDAWQRFPEDGVDEKEARAYLVGHRGADGARPLREPERGDLAAELSRLPLVLAREQIRIVEPPEALGDPLELREHGPTLGLGGMSRQHQLDPERGDERGHLLGRDSPCLELGDRLSERLVERLRVPGPLALAQDADALPFLGEIHEVEVDGEGRGGGPGRIRGERGHLGGEIAWGRRRSRATRLGQAADPLFGFEEGDRLPRPEHIAERLTEQVDGRRKVHDRSGDV